jgi:propionaldehyde dehydrogenase
LRRCKATGYFGDKEKKMHLDDKLVNKIVDAVVQRLAAEQPPANPALNPEKSQAKGSFGVFPNMDACIPAAVEAQKKLLTLALETRRRIIQAIRDTGKANAREYARLEFEETGLGKLEDNAAKNLSACEVLGLEDLVPEVYAGDKGVTIIERLPVGVIASVHPVTNAAPSILFNAVMMISGGNTVVVNPYPPARSGI